LARAVIYAFFAGTAFRIVSHTGSSHTGQQELWTAKAIQHSVGQWAVGHVIADLDPVLIAP
jgi:hypothetical protein